MDSSATLVQIVKQDDCDNITVYISYYNTTWINVFSKIEFSTMLSVLYQENSFTKFDTIKKYLSDMVNTEGSYISCIDFYFPTVESMQEVFTNPFRLSNGQFKMVDRIEEKQTSECIKNVLMNMDEIDKVEEKQTGSKRKRVDGCDNVNIYEDYDGENYENYEDNDNDTELYSTKRIKVM